MKAVGVTSPANPSAYSWGGEYRKEEVMVSQDYLLVALIIASALYLIYWAGGHPWRHDSGRRAYRG